MRKSFRIEPTNKNNKDVARLAIRYIKELDFEKSHEVIVKDYRKTKSEEQRGWFHKLCQILADETGHRPNEIKTMVKQKVYGSSYKMVGKRRYIITESSEYDEDGEERSTVDYGRLIEGIYELGAEAEVVLPKPRKNFNRR